jgi:biopolymer transport protein ExbD
MAEAHEEKLGPVAVKRLIRKKQRRNAQDPEITYLNITAMMDMMTIILVYLLKQFSVTTTAVASDEIRLPYSSSQLPMKQAVNVTITKNAILVEDSQVVALRNGQVDPSDKQGGANSYLVTPLLTVMGQHRDRLKAIAARSQSNRFEGEVTIQADAGTPYRLVTEVLYTVGQAEFGRYRLVVLKRGE